MLKKCSELFKGKFNMFSGRFVYDGFESPGSAVPSRSENPAKESSNVEKASRKPKTAGIDMNDKTHSGADKNLDKVAASAGVKVSEVKTAVNPTAKPATKPSEQQSKVTSEKPKENAPKKPSEYVLEHWEKQRAELAKQHVKFEHVDLRGIKFKNQHQRALYFFIEDMRRSGHKGAKKVRQQLFMQNGYIKDSVTDGENSLLAREMGFYWEDGKWHLSENNEGDDVLGENENGDGAYSFYKSIPRLIKLYKSEFDGGEHMTAEAGKALGTEAEPFLMLALTKHELLNATDIEELADSGVTYDEAVKAALSWMAKETEKIKTAFDKMPDGKWFKLENEQMDAMKACMLLNPSVNPVNYMYMKQGKMIFMMDKSGAIMKVNIGVEPSVPNFGEGETFKKENFVGLWHPINFERIPAKDAKAVLEVAAKEQLKNPDSIKGVVPAGVYETSMEAAEAKEKAKLQAYINAVNAKMTLKPALRRDPDRVKDSLKSELDLLAKATFEGIYKDDKEAMKPEVKDKVIGFVVAGFMKTFEELFKAESEKYEKVSKVRVTLIDGNLKVEVKGKLKPGEKKPGTLDKAKAKAKEMLDKAKGVLSKFKESALGGIFSFAVSLGILDEKKADKMLVDIFSGKKGGILALFLAKKGFGTKSMVAKANAIKPDTMMGKVMGYMDKAVAHGKKIAGETGVPMEGTKESVAEFTRQLNTPLDSDMKVTTGDVAVMDPSQEVLVARISGGVKFSPSKKVTYRKIGESKWRTQKLESGQSASDVEIKVHELAGDVIPKGATLLVEKPEVVEPPRAVVQAAPSAPQVASSAPTESVIPAASVTPAAPKNPEKPTT